MRNENFRSNTRSLYDVQKLRIQNGNRLCASFRNKLGLLSSEAEETHEDAETILKSIRSEFKRITDGVKRITKNIEIDSPLITKMAELRMIESYERLLESEAIHEKILIEALAEEPIYTQFLSNIRGVGPLMASVLLSEIDIHACNSISALHKYAGLDVVVYEKDGETLEEGRCMKSHHLVPKQYTNRKGEIIDTVGITFNPFLKTKLIGVLGSSFIKLGGPYREIYDGYKFRLQNHPKHKDKPKGHIHAMSVRYMVKEFLADLWTHWRTIEGLPVRSRYAEEKLGIVHSKQAA